MDLKKILGENKIHIPIVLLIIMTQFFVKEIAEGYYKFQIRPKLMSTSEQGGFRLCAGYQPIIAEYKPNNCDLVKVIRSGHNVEEFYFTNGGSEQIHAFSTNGQWTHTDTEYRANQFSSYIPLTAFLALMVSIFHKVIRTGKFTTWSLSRHHSDRIESVLQFYAWPVFVSSILFGWLGR